MDVIHVLCEDEPIVVEVMAVSSPVCAVKPNRLRAASGEAIVGEEFGESERQMGRTTDISKAVCLPSRTKPCLLTLRNMGKEVYPSDTFPYSTKPDRTERPVSDKADS
jgi:hypothetical protein